MIFFFSSQLTARNLPGSHSSAPLGLRLSVPGVASCSCRHVQQRGGAFHLDRPCELKEPRQKRTGGKNARNHGLDSGLAPARLPPRRCRRRRPAPGLFGSGQGTGELRCPASERWRGPAMGAPEEDDPKDTRGSSAEEGAEEGRAPQEEAGGGGEGEGNTPDEGGAPEQVGNVGGGIRRLGYLGSGQGRAQH